ncbi:hypothetical protein NQ176_g11353 [Zarea fungicola]|uniref:Uncharacterized protein n=1 Tax=Zarea fungicola TaxID=93591 RepID=A0ACC1MBS3_9HYPO|nr:hypothetical protein NQ176_g11353 [Lecanicillium fungicola]
MKFSTLAAATLTLASTAVAQSNIYLIRHAEKNDDGTISAQGKQREQCLITVFGAQSNYNIQKIIVQNPYDGGTFSLPLALPPPKAKKTMANPNAN